MSRHLKRLASITVWSLALVVLVVPLTAQAAAAPTASNDGTPGVTPSQKAARASATAEGLAFLATAQALAPYVVRESDGTLSLDAPGAAVNGLQPKYVSELRAGLRVLNAKVAAGELQTTEGGAVFDPKADSLNVQGGWTGHGYSWWGQYWCLSHTDLWRLHNYLTSGSTLWLTGSILGLIAAIPGTYGLVAVFIGLYFYWMLSVDYGNGSCLNASWAGGPLWVTSQ
jgi:hypothetical protein